MPDKLGPLRTLIWNMPVRRTAQEYFVLGSHRYVLLAFKYNLAMRYKILSIDHYVTCKNEVDIGRHIYISTRTDQTLFLFTSKGLMLEGFTTFMDCCLRTRARNVVYRNEVDYLGGID